MKSWPPTAPSRLLKNFFVDVIPSGARNLLVSRDAENKADSSARQKTPGFGMTSPGFFQHPASRAALTAAAVFLLGLAVAAGVRAAQVAIPEAADEAAFRRVSNRLLCQCGCNYMVLSCNHLDCPSATYIRKTIKTSLTEGKSEDAIVALFVEQYGERILPEPPKAGFSLLGWFMPYIALLAGLAAVLWVIRQWLWGARETPALAGEAGGDPLLRIRELEPAVMQKHHARIERDLENE